MRKSPIELRLAEEAWEDEIDFEELDSPRSNQRNKKDRW